jgi:hypothetical protein
MRHHHAPTAETPSELPGEEMANLCRRAALRVVQGAARGWGKQELAKWLRESYAQLAVHDGGSVPPPSSGGGATEALAEGRVERMLETMRMDVLFVLRELMTPEGLEAFSEHVVEKELVLQSHDAHGRDLLLPRARHRMTLADRVISLLAVDALLRPQDYEHDLFICERCEAPVFDRDGRESGKCAVHRSGIVELE